MTESNAAPALIDFLYADHERVASFVSQLSGMGVLKGYERQSDKQKTNKKEGGVDFGIIKGGLGSDTNWHRGIRETYDPLWETSVSLVRHVESTQILRQPQIEVGQLVCISGKLFALDLAFIRGLMDAESMTEFIARGAKNDDLNTRNQSQKKINKSSEEYKNAQVMVEYMKTIPLDIQFMMHAMERAFSFNIKREYLNLHQSDIPLKFPFQISGTWSIVGVVDAAPEDHISGTIALGEKINSLYPALAQPFIQLIGTSSIMFGRNMQAFGLSPLAIYRRIQALG